MSARRQRTVRGRLTAVTLAVTALLALPGPTSTAYAADDPADPLKVTLDQLGATTLDGSTKGKVDIRGTVTNTTTDTWTGVKIYPCLGRSPITTEAGLAHAATLPADALVCERIVHDGAFATVPTLAPHKSYAWHISLPRKLLESEAATKPGVYWFGVHALGPQSPTVADGRARTFLPVVSAHNKTNGNGPAKRPEEVALVLPLRHSVSYHSDGRVADVSTWTRDLKGSLADLLAVGRRLPSATWAVDPAVLDAVHRLADGNPPRDLDPTDGATETGASGSASPSTLAPSQPTDTETTSTEDARLDSAAKTAATAWLKQLDPALDGHEVLALPYADPDLPALAAADKTLYKTARAQAEATFKSLGIDVTPATVPPSGYLDSSAVKLLSDDSVTLVGDRMIKGTAPAVAAVDGHRLVVTSSGAASGGPGPGSRTDTVSMRQRIISQAALMREQGRPLIVVLPGTWTAPAVAADFTAAFTGTSWLRTTSVADAVRDQSVESVTTSRLDYPSHEKKVQIPSSRLSTANDLIRSGEVLQRVLTHNSSVASDVVNEALTTTSYAARGADTGAGVQALSVIDSGLRRISVDGPPAVILSSTKGGKFQVTVRNDLPQTVTVRLQGLTDSRVRIGRTAPIQIDANSRTTWTMSASMSDPGTHTATIVVTDTEGNPIGSETRLEMRSAQVSAVIWWFVGTGCALLFAAIAVRLTRRVTGARHSRTA